MKYITLTLALFTAPLAATADPMSAAEFEAYVTGKTLYYGRTGEAYGAEIYHENRRVTWSFLDGECKDGRWYNEGTNICFVYEDRPDPQCWSFEQSAGGLVATFENNSTSQDLYEAQDVGEKLICLGPKIGV
ncbi:hypothetical protein [Tateyamaria sp.]|uniref:hypothetical protein n=1 Tax=Tateyamaria sp. TaxID=1929288 RepID=UPI00329B30C3